MKSRNSIFTVLRFRRGNWKAVVLCIFAATVFWFFNALNKTYTTNLKFPLAFEYDRENFVPVKSLPDEVRINVTGNGWLLFRRSAGLKIPPLEIPLERPSEIKRIVGSTLPGFFSNQLDGLDINYVLTDTIYVDLEPKTTRWISVAIDTATLDIREGYTLASNVSILPDSIEITGPRRIVNGIEEPVQIKIPSENIDENFMEDVEVQFNSTDVIRRDPPTVAVMFTVDKLITITDSAELIIKNVPNNVWPVFGRKKIPITISGPQNMTQKFAIDSVKAILDLSTVKKGTRKLLPEVTGLPPYFDVVNIDSVSVKF